MIKWIDDFLALAEYKQFSVAADSIYISQSALSKHIKALESDLGVVLFIRSNTKAELTDAGKIYLEYALNVRKLTREMQYKLSKITASTNVSHLSIGSIPCLVESGIMQLIIDFQEKNKSYSLEISETDQIRLLKQLASKEIDVAICRIDFLSSGDFEIVPIVTDELVFICNKDMFPFEQGSEIDLSSIKLENVYTISKESDIFRLVKKQLAEVGYDEDFAGTFPRHMMIFPILINSQKKCCAIMPKQVANIQMYPQLTYYRIKNAVKTQIGLVSLIPNGINDDLYRKTKALFDYFRDRNNK